MLQKQGIFLKNKKGIHLISTAEKKLLLVLSYYIIAGVSGLVYFAVFTADLDMIRKTVASYFLCEAFGHVPGKCDRTHLQRFWTWWLQGLTYLFIGCIPLVYMTFVVNFTTVKKVLCRHKRKHSIGIDLAQMPN